MNDSNFIGRNAEDSFALKRFWIFRNTHKNSTFWHFEDNQLSNGGNITGIIILYLHAKSEAVSKDAEETCKTGRFTENDLEQVKNLLFFFIIFHIAGLP